MTPTCSDEVPPVSMKHAEDVTDLHTPRVPPAVSSLTELICRLTVKLRGRAEAPDQSRGCKLSSRTRGETTALHGPLQRLLDGWY